VKRRIRRYPALGKLSQKLVIHSGHIEPINQALTLTAVEFGQAPQVIALFEHNPDAGIATTNGKIIDKPHERPARKISERASPG
jgi:citrate lyase subunit beta/citryl-CoA lyase